MRGQHNWSSEWYDSGPVNDASVKVCEDCGAELIVTWVETEKPHSAEKKTVATLVYVAPCAGKPRS